MAAGGKKPRYSQSQVRESVNLYLIMLPSLVLIFVFCYVPIYGLVIAFQTYTPGKPFLAFDGSVTWVGLKHFASFINSMYFGRIIKNTLWLSLLNLAFGFWVPIFFALLVNEITGTKYKKFVQTASYMPHFISAVVVAGIVLSFIAQDGIINNIIEAAGGKRTAYNVTPSAFPVVYTITNIWRSFGWSSILYLSTISSIDPELYEAAMLDGANRPRRIWHITIPHIAPMAAILLIFAIGSLLGSNTELILLLYNSATYETADVIGTYLYRQGLLGGQFSFGTAVGIFISVINFILLFIANYVSNRLTNFGIW